MTTITPEREYTDVYTATQKLLRTVAEIEDAVRPDLKRRGLTVSLYYLMRGIATSAESAVRPSDLADQLHVTTGGVTRIVDRAVSAGLAERRPSPSDKRGCLVELTPIGLQIYREATPAFEQTLTQYWAQQVEVQA